MKSPIASKTLWFNVLALVALIATEVAGWDIVQSNPTAAKGAAAVVLIVNMILRFTTSQSIVPPKDE